VVRSWEAPCRPGAEGSRRRTVSCALAVPDALAVRYSNPNCYRPRWVKQVSSDKASPPTHCVNLVSRNRGSPDRFESDWMHDTARCLGYPSDSTRPAWERASGDTLQSPLAPVAWLSAPADQLSHIWPASAVSLQPWALGGLTGAPTTAPDRTRTQRRCRRHRRAAGGGTGPARTAGGYRRAMYSLSPGRRRRSATCQWLWTYSQGCSRACQIKPGHSVAAAVIGVQRGAGLGWHGPRVDLLARRDLGGSGAVALAFARA